MKSDWKLTTLADFCNMNPIRSVKKGSEVPFVAMTEIDAGARDIPNFELKPFNSGTKFIDGDTLFARITPCLENGKTALVNILGEGVIGAGSTEYIVLNPKNKETDSNFIYYLARLPELRKFAEKKMEGTSGRQRVSAQALGEFEFILPPPEVRKEIGQYLAFMDDKINANNDMNQTLEKFAQRIFKSWFIDFDPVKANAEGLPFAGVSPDIQSLFPNEFVESEMGLIPKGWDYEPLNSISKFVNEKQPIKQVNITNYISTNNMLPERSGVIHTDSLPDVARVNSYKKGDVLWSNIRPYFKKVWFAEFEGGSSGDVLIWRTLEPCKVDNYFLYGVIARDEFINYSVRTAKGVKMPRGDKEAMMSYKICVPSKEVAHSYTDIVTPLYERIAQNRAQNINLSQIKDKLLPKLLSGSIEIKQELDEAS